jgi:hypothetical protein
MAGFIEEADRRQLSLSPGSLDDWVDKDNPVRVIDTFVDGFDLKKLGFETVEALDIGRQGYHPSVTRSGNCFRSELGQAMWQHPTSKTARVMRASCELTRRGTPALEQLHDLTGRPGVDVRKGAFSPIFSPWDPSIARPPVARSKHRRRAKENPSRRGRRAL